MSISLLAVELINAQILPPSYNPMPKEKIERFENDARKFNERRDEIYKKRQWLSRNAADIRHSDSDDSLVIHRLRDEEENYRFRIRELHTLINRDSLELIRQTSLATKYALDSLSLMQGVDSMRIEVLKKVDSLKAKRNQIIVDSLQALRKSIGALIPAKNLTQRDSLKLALAIDSLLTLGSLQLEVQELNLKIQTDSVKSIFLAGLSKQSEQVVRELSGSFNANRRVSDSLSLNQIKLMQWRERLQGGSGKRLSVIYELEREIQSLSQQADSLGKVSDSLLKISSDYRSIAERFFIPVQKYDDAVKFYGAPNVLSSVTFNLITRSANINGYTNYFGPVRFGASLIMNLEETPSNDVVGNLNQFYSGGGNLVLHFSFPLIFNGSQYHGITLQSMIKTSVSQIFSVPYYNIDVGVEAYGVISPVHWGRFFGYFRTGLAIGIRGFYEKIGYERESPFFYGQVVAGVEIWEIKLLISGIAFSPDNLGRPITLNNFTVQAPLPR
ncbi:MAG: hypothetical protein SFU91_08980 [Chloroherpetonaceae bacterium]|nr:hypothetical protein [Chloroherpetonaceae bacterium]